MLCNKMQIFANVATNINISLDFCKLILRIRSVAMQQIKLGKSTVSPSRSSIEMLLYIYFMPTVSVFVAQPIRNITKMLTAKTLTADNNLAAIRCQAKG